LFSFWTISTTRSPKTKRRRNDKAIRRKKKREEFLKKEQERKKKEEIQKNVLQCPCSPFEQYRQQEALKQAEAKQREKLQPSIELSIKKNFHGKKLSEILRKLDPNVVLNSPSKIKKKSIQTKFG